MLRKLYFIAGILAVLVLMGLLGQCAKAGMPPSISIVLCDNQIAYFLVEDDDREFIRESNPQGDISNLVNRGKLVLKTNAVDTAPTITISAFGGEKCGGWNS